MREKSPIGVRDDLRESPLARDPQVDAITMRELVGIANAIEQESARRYAALADTMQRRGETATAAAFRAMHDEELAHVDAVAQWAAALGEPVPAAEEFRWRLPEDLASSWEDVAGSARLTPYRAFAVAVENERRAFTMYSYLAARATQPRVAAEAERLALEELRHASVMRRWRRQAWHRERRAFVVQAPAIGSVAQLRELLARNEAVLASRHRTLAARLRAIGDEESARVLESCLAEPTWPPAPQAPPPAGDAPASAQHVPDADANAVHLLVAAQEPLEAFSETLEAVMRAAEGETFAQAERALANVVTRLARIALQSERRLQAA